MESMASFKNLYKDPTYEKLNNAISRFSPSDSNDVKKAIAAFKKIIKALKNKTNVNENDIKGLEKAWSNLLDTYKMNEFIKVSNIMGAIRVLEAKEYSENKRKYYTLLMKAMSKK